MGERIQRRRAKGWRLPANAVIVDRTTPWGNPFVVGKDGDRKKVVELYRHLMGGYIVLTANASIEAQRASRRFVAENISQLRGKDLACWCGAGPCHADVLLEIAGKEPGADV